MVDVEMKSEDKREEEKKGEEEETKAEPNDQFYGKSLGNPSWMNGMSNKLRLYRVEEDTCDL